MESFVQTILGAGVTTAFHPVNYSRVLIQLGHEPLAPVESTTFLGYIGFGKKVLLYPNVFKYMGHIRKVDGFLGLYRGLGPRLAGGFVGNLVSTNIQRRLQNKKKPVQPGQETEEIDGDSDEDEESLSRLIREISYDTTARCAAVIVSHPFNVIMVRSMAQFIGRETIYNNSFDAITEIYDKEGITGFFVGLVPRLLGEVATIWLTSALKYLVKNYIIPKEQKDMKNYSSTVCSLITSQVVYPFMLVSNVMCANDCLLAAGSPPNSAVYSTWRHCWAELKKQNQLKRGSSLFSRYYKGPVITRYDGSLVPANLGLFS